jgi:hypothetical protein
MEITVEVAISMPERWSIREYSISQSHREIVQVKEHNHLIRSPISSLSKLDFP